MKNGFVRLSVALLAPTIQFGLLNLCSTVCAQQETAAPTPEYFENPTDEEETSSPATLPLPQHPGRLPEPPSSSLPKESQPNRAERPQKPVSARRTTSMLIPGRPSRNLPPPGFPEEGGSDAFEAESGSLEAEETVGLLGFLPHQFYNGGLSFECIYTGETFTKARGGITSGRPTNYRSNLDLVGILDTERMGWWDSGRFFVYGQNLSGRPLSATEVGKQDANADFALSDLGGDFVHSSFGLPPMIPLPTFPSQALGIASFYNVTETVALGFAIYDGTLPSGPQGVRWGFDTLGQNGAISLYQLEFKPQLGPNGELPTTIRTGYWYHSSNESWVEFDDVPDPRTFRRNYGCYTTIDQMIWKEEFGGDNDQGLGVFFQFGWAPSNRNALTEYYGGGLVYKGLLPGRDEDLLGLGIASARFSDHFRTAEADGGTDIAPSETAIELFYKAIVGKSLSLQPDIQYIANPGGQYKDALLPGLRFEAIF